MEQIAKTLQSHGVSTRFDGKNWFAKSEWTKDGVEGFDWVLMPTTIRAAREFLGY